MRRLLLTLIAFVSLGTPAYAQQWDQVNGSMQVRSGPSSPLVIIDQTASGQKILSLRANGTEVCFASSTAFTCTSAFSFAAPLTISTTALGTTSTDGAVLVNTTAATGAVTVQISPRLRLRGNAWDTAASQTVDFFWENLPATAATPTGTAKLGYSLNGGAITYPLTVSSAGVVIVSGTLFGSGVSVSPATGTIGWDTRSALSSPADGQANLRNTANSAGVGLDFATDGTLKVRTRAQADTAIVDAKTFQASAAAGSFGLARAFAVNTAPTVANGCTGEAMVWNNGTIAFEADMGSTCAGVSTVIFTLPATTNAWVCTAINVTTSATAAMEMTASDTTTATFTNYTRTTGIALTFVDGANVRVGCVGG